MKIGELSELITTVAPIHGIDSNGEISFKEGVTPEEKAAAFMLVEKHIGEVDSAKPTDLIEAK